MADCVEITREIIRAKMTIAGYEVETPYVKSFSVQVSRSNPIRTMSATLEVDANFSDYVDLSIPDPDTLDPEDMPVILEAGNIAEGQDMQVIFRGFITSARVSPSWDKMDRIILNIQGKDAFYRLEGRTINRRNPFSRGGRWAVIRSVAKKSKSFAEPGGGRLSLAAKSGRPDIHLSGSRPDSARVITTPDIVDYPVMEVTKDYKKLDLVLDPEVVYVTAGQGTEINLSLSETKNSTIDYSNAIHTDEGKRQSLVNRWVVDTAAQSYVTVEEDPDHENDDRYVVVKINENTFFPGQAFGITFYSDEVDPTQARKRRGRIIFYSIIPHTHESMAQGGPAFGTFS